MNCYCYNIAGPRIDMIFTALDSRFDVHHQTTIVLAPGDAMHRVSWGFNTFTVRLRLKMSNSLGTRVSYTTTRYGRQVTRRDLA